MLPISVSRGIVAHMTGTMECTATLVLVREPDGWRRSAFHNTRVMVTG